MKTMLETIHITLKLVGWENQTVFDLRTLWSDNPPLPSAGDTIVVEERKYRVMARTFTFGEKELEVVLHAEKRP